MIELLNMDCMDFMAGLPDKAFELAIVDPPYSDHFAMVGCSDNAAIKGRYGFETLNGHKPTEHYWDELFRVSKNQIVWGANWYGKFFGVGGVCWFKDNTGNYSPCEYAYQSFNNQINHFEYRWNGMLQGNMAKKESRIHPTQKPVALYEWLLTNYAKPGDRILDTHLGSGSSAIAAHNLGFDFVGMELDPDYYQAAVKRFEQHKAQSRLFDCDDYQRTELDYKQDSLI